MIPCSWHGVDHFIDDLEDSLPVEVRTIVDKVINAVQEHGITEEELRQAKVNFRSSFLENLRAAASGYELNLPQH